MVAWQRCTEVRWPSLAMARLGEERTSIAVMTQTYLAYLGLVGSTGEGVHMHGGAVAHSARAVR